MPTTFKNAVNTGIGTTPVDLLTTPEGFRVTVIGCNLANTTDYDTVNVDVVVVDETSTSAYYVKGITIPPNSAVKVVTNGEKLILPEGQTLRVVSDTTNSIDATVSFVEIS
jgi:hypothetical protein